LQHSEDKRSEEQVTEEQVLVQEVEDIQQIGVSKIHKKQAASFNATSR